LDVRGNCPKSFLESEHFGRRDASDGNDAMVVLLQFLNLKALGNKMGLSVALSKEHEIQTVCMLN
jgi:hypothetical protein